MIMLIPMLTPMATGIPMADLQSLIRLQTWLSPAFPTGAFSYSHGLEAAIGNSMISGADELADWLECLLTSGPGWNDAVLLSVSWRVARQGGDMEEVAALAKAVSFSATRHLETTAQGSAFLLASRAWCDRDGPEDCPLPVAVGAVAGKLDVDLEHTLSTYLHAYVSNQIQAALRLMKLGQQGGLEILASLESVVIETAQRAAVSSLEELGSSTAMADIAAMQHETMESRIFRS